MTYSCLKVGISFDPINAMTIALLVLSLPTIAFMPVKVSLVETESILAVVLTKHSTSTVSSDA